MGDSAVLWMCVVTLFVSSSVALAGTQQTTIGRLRDRHLTAHTTAPTNCTWLSNCAYHRRWTRTAPFDKKHASQSGKPLMPEPRPGAQETTSTYSRFPHATRFVVPIRAL